MQPTQTTETANVAAPSVTVTNPNNVSLASLREAYVAGEGAIKVTAKAYAVGLLDNLGTAWLTLAHDAKGAEGDAMRAERDILYKALRDVGHTNPSVKWGQIKDQARAVLAERERAARIAAGETAEEIDAEAAAEGSGGAKHTRTLQLRLIEDLKTLFKACKKEKAKTDQQSKAQLHIGAALADLGVDISNL